MVALNGLKTVSESYVTLINCGPGKTKNRATRKENYDTYNTRNNKN